MTAYDIAMIVFGLIGGTVGVCFLTMLTPEEKGYRAGRNGDEYTSNPFPRYGADWADWNVGWLEGAEHGEQ